MAACVCSGPERRDDFGVRIPRSAEGDTSDRLPWRCVARPAFNDSNLVGFREGLSGTGYIEGKNLVIEYRWAEGHYDRLTALAADHVNRKVDVIVATGGTPSALAAKSATSTIPIVFLADSAMAIGLANSLARPSGNFTGFFIFGHELS